MSTEFIWILCHIRYRFICNGLATLYFASAIEQVWVVPVSEMQACNFFSRVVNSTKPNARSFSRTLGAMVKVGYSSASQAHWKQLQLNNYISTSKCLINIDLGGREWYKVQGHHQGYISSITNAFVCCVCACACWLLCIFLGWRQTAICGPLRGLASQ